MHRPPPRVYTIPPSQPFLPTLIRALIDGRLVDLGAPAGDPMALAGATLYLPTQRACRLARDVFLDVTGADAAVLPRIVALGDIDEADLAFAEMPGTGDAEAALGLPPALGGLARRMLLARLVLAWTAQLAPPRGEPPLVVPGLAAAFALADALAHLMDDMTMREVPWERLDTLVPVEVDEYWRITLEFLKIARVEWPNILAAAGAIEPARRRDLLIAAQAARLAAVDCGPVIAAGSTGSIPATARLIEAVARAPRGAVVLPGLDLTLDAEAWDLIGDGASSGDADAPAYGHPQYAMRGLLERLALPRAGVVALAEPAVHGREWLTSQALRPAAATESWRALMARADSAARLADSLTGLTVIEAANAEEEALAIAVAMRETLEDTARTVALVSPDRALARRVIAALARWNVDAEDSAGDALADTPAGIFARLALDAGLGALAPVDLLALLKHPQLRLGAAPGAHAAAIVALELAVLRGPRPRAGSAGLTNALTTLRGELARLRRGESTSLHRADPRARLDDAELAAAAALVDALAAALAPLERLEPDTEVDLVALAARHRDALVLLAGAGDGWIMGGADGEALAAAFDDIALHGASAAFKLKPTDYVRLFTTLIGERNLRRPHAGEPRARIYGLLEARLASADRVILGGLVEGVWPPQAPADPWLSRPMRRALGLDLPERRIGLSAHDFAQLLGAPDVIITRAARLAGAPTVPSRFVQRLAAVAGETAWEGVRAAGDEYLRLARALDQPAQAIRIARPEPRPPLAARPRALSVTEIEDWLRDPYTIYARHVLRLRPYEPIDMAPGALDRGVAIHQALAEFTRRHAQSPPADAVGELMACGRAAFAALADAPLLRAFWWPRFERIAHWFVGWEKARRAAGARVRVEASGAITLAADARRFTLRGRADRIEQRADGSYVILDYKTGNPPSARQVRSGLAPQLTLEAAMLHAGGFDDIAPGATVSGLVYVKLTGGEPGGEEYPINFKDSSTPAQAERALRRLVETVACFDDEAQPYLSLVRPQWQGQYGDYDHLARVKEWSVGGDDDGGGGE